MPEKETVLEERLLACQKSKDWAGLARTYYELGVQAMETGDLNRAWLWLHRADTVYSAQDDVCEAVGDALMDDCSQRIGTLEEMPLLYNTLPAEVEEKARSLGGMQVQVWGLLSLARLVTLGRRLAELPGCALLGELDVVVEQMRTQLENGSDPRDLVLDGFHDAFYEFGDSPEFFGGGEIDVPGGAPFQVFDLNSGTGGFWTLCDFLKGHRYFLECLLWDGDNYLSAAESGIVTYPLLLDYYARTGGGRLEDVPQVQRETARIWSDYDFLRTGPTWVAVKQRLDSYRKLDLLQS